MKDDKLKVALVEDEAPPLTTVFAGSQKMVHPA